MTILLFTLLLYFSAPSGNDITGIWLNPEKTRSIRIFEQHGKHYGIMDWIGEPEPKLRKGQLVLKNLVYENGAFKNGLAFTPVYGWVACDARINNRQLHPYGA